MALAVAYLRAATGGPPLEAIVPEPAFEIFRFDTAVAGGTLVQVMPHAGFHVFRSDDVLAAITAAHARRVPDQPEQSDRRRRCRSRRSARSRARMPPDAVVFVDEAYAEFAGVSFIPELDALSQRHRRPDVFEGVRPGRPAHRLPGRRAGRRSMPIRRAVPVYSVNIAAAVAMSGGARRSAITCTAICARSAESKALLYAACDRLGLKYWTSDANFVLVRAGDRTDGAGRKARSRGASTCATGRREPGCAGCIRIATGIVEHTRARSR